MICPVCEGKGFVPASDHEGPTTSWDGSERRKADREADNARLRFDEVVPAARFRCCVSCDGAGKLFLNAMATI